MVDENKIMQALHDRLKSGMKVAHSARRLPPVDQTPSEQFPAMFVSAIAGRDGSPIGLPSRWTIGALVYVLAKAAPAGQKDAVPEAPLFALFDQAKAALARQEDEVFQLDAYGTTLGGLVWSCRITDFHIHDEWEPQAAMSFTVEMIAT